MLTTKINIQAAQRIVIPSGRDYERCLEAFETTFGVSVPRFESRLLTRKAANNTIYVKVKGKDIPAYIANGSADIGLTGTDVCEEQIPEKSNLLYKAIGKPMCTFNLLLPTSSVDEITTRLTSPSAKPVRIATSYPRLLRRCIERAQEVGQVLNITIEQFKPSGSVEALPGWVAEAVADIVESGETATANNLVIGSKLADIYPAVIWRNPNMQPTPLNLNFFGVDTSLNERLKQVDNLSVTSYSIERLRDPNQALKDYGEESAEFLESVVTGKANALDELADLLFASLVLARANSADVSLADVVQRLEGRNLESSLRKEDDDKL